MTDLSEKLSAYLDGELDQQTAEAVETLLANDPDAQAELDAIMEADALALSQFEGALDDPVPFALAKQIRDTHLEPKQIAAAPRPIWGTIAACFVFLVLGGAGGFLARGPAAPVQTAGWLADIADYHAVYASQGRHLVEVSANESDHIETWLGSTIGAQFSIPNLTEYGLVFEGGRLVVANGKPVAQLMYRLADGTVVALCLQSSSKDTGGEPTFSSQTINGFDFVSWSANGADYVVIGPEGQPDLDTIASAASIDI